MTKNTPLARLAALVTVLLVATAQFGCGSVVQTTDWYTVSSDRLEELSEDPRRSASSRNIALRFYVDCDGESPDRQQSPHYVEHCTALDIGGGDEIRVFPAYREPLVLSAFEFTVDDVQLRMDEEGSPPRIVERDEIVAVHVGEQRRSKTRTVAFAAPTFLASYMAAAFLVLVMFPHAI